MRDAALNALAYMARYWIRYAPISTGKVWLWERSHWRLLRNFKARTRFGMLVTGNTRDLIQRWLYFTGIWEPHITHWLRSVLKPGDCFVDVGANIGYYSLLASRLVGPSGSVVAIEPAEGIYNILIRHIKLNRLANVRAVHAAVSDKERVLYIRPGGEENIGSTRTIEAPDSRSIGSVQAYPLDAILSADEIAKARVIKIDVEGGEEAVIRSLQPMLHRLRPEAQLLVELNGSNSPCYGGPEILGLMESHGFGAYELTNDYDMRKFLSCGNARPPVPIRDRSVKSSCDVVFSRQPTGIIEARG